MIRILGKIPNKVTLACSGGIDSMAVLDFLRNGRKKVTVAHFNHRTEHGWEAYEFVKNYCKENDIPFIGGDLEGDKPKDKSWEEWWRDKRYDFLNSLPGPIITAHHLNDVGEWWIFTFLNGNPRLTPYKNGKIIRPFLLTLRHDMMRWCRINDVPYVDDPQNLNFKYARCRIRHEIIPSALEINPGFLTVVGKKIKEEFKKNHG